MRPLKIILLSSAFNGLTQRAWLQLQESGQDVSFLLFTTKEAVVKHVLTSGADLVICPFLKDRVPEVLWKNTKRPVIIVHPGIVGDRGISSLDWAILNKKTHWGVTALQAVEEMDAGPIWATANFKMPKKIRKSELYNGLVADAAMCCIHEVVEKFSRGFSPIVLDYDNPEVQGRLQANMKQLDRQFNWSDSAEDILRHINAADGCPGVLAPIAGKNYYLYDAHLDHRSGKAGEILAVFDDAVLVGAGDKSIWIGYLKEQDKESQKTFKLPATAVLGAQVLASVPKLAWSIADEKHCNQNYQPISYRCLGEIGELTFEFYNGAMSTLQCLRLKEALQWAKAQDTTVLVIKGGRGSFSNGVHLNVIEAAKSPNLEAWENIQAINDVCEEILSAKQVVIAGLTGSAGAGGVMVALAADVVFARADIVLNPHYQTMGLYGSEYWTYTLPRSVGEVCAKQLTNECFPVSTRKALKLGMVQEVGPREVNQFNQWLWQQAELILSGKQKYYQARKRLQDPEKILLCRTKELEEMKQDMVENRRYFAKKCHNFVYKKRAESTPKHLVASWVLVQQAIHIKDIKANVIEEAVI